MPESNVIDDAQRGISERNRGIVQTKRDEVADYKLPGYKLPDTRIDLYPQTSKQQVVTRSGEQPYSKAMPGMIATELSYQPIGEGSEIHDVYFQSMLVNPSNKETEDREIAKEPEEHPPKTPERFSESDKGIAHRGIKSPIHPKKRGSSRQKQRNVQLGIPTLMPKKDQPPGIEKTHPKPPPPMCKSKAPTRRDLTFAEFEKIHDLLMSAAEWEFVPGYGRGKAEELKNEAAFYLARLGVLSFSEYEELEKEGSIEAITWAIIDGAIQSLSIVEKLAIPLKYAETYAEKVKLIFETRNLIEVKRQRLFHAITLKKDIFLNPNRVLSQDDMTWRECNMLFGEIVHEQEIRAGQDMGDAQFKRDIVKEEVKKKLERE